MGWGGVSSCLSNVSDLETVLDLNAELSLLNSLFLLIIISSSKFFKVDIFQIEHSILRRGKASLISLSLSSRWIQKNGWS